MNKKLWSNYSNDYNEIYTEDESTNVKSLNNCCSLLPQKLATGQQKIVVAMIVNLSTADIINATFNVIPNFTFMLTGNWPFGELGNNGPL